MPATRWTTTVIAAVALTLGASGLAQAQPGHHPGARGGPQHHDRGGYHPDSRPPHHGWHPGARHPGPPPHAHGPRHAPRGPAHHARGVGPKHQWYAGTRVPPQYRGSRHVVHDWRGHRLHQPPRGHHWVRYGNDYMLVAIATGVITQLVLHHLY